LSTSIEGATPMSGLKGADMWRAMTLEIHLSVKLEDDPDWLDPTCVGQSEAWRTITSRMMFTMKSREAG